MAERERSLDCPVCPGRAMGTLRPSPDLDLTLECCDRCGGVWFDAGEVLELRKCHPRALARQITVPKQLLRIECPQCGRSVARNAIGCAECGWRSVLRCPGCRNSLERVETPRFTVDACRSCRGAWFDNIELSQIWNVRLDAWERKTRRAHGASGQPDALSLAEILLYTPDGAAYLLGEAASATGDLVVGAVSAAPDAAAAVVEATGELAGGVFEAIAEIIGGLFSF